MFKVQSSWSGSPSIIKSTPLLQTYKAFRVSMQSRNPERFRNDQPWLIKITKSSSFATRTVEYKGTKNLLSLKRNALLPPIILIFNDTVGILNFKNKASQFLTKYILIN